MKYNKYSSNKINEKKTLRKVKKNWMVFSLSVFGAISVGSILSNDHDAYADVLPAAVHTTTSSSATSSAVSSSAIKSVTSSPSTTSSQTSSASSNAVSSVVTSSPSSADKPSLVASDHNSATGTNSLASSANGSHSSSISSSATIGSVSSDDSLSSMMESEEASMVDSLKNAPLGLYLASNVPTSLVNIASSSSYNYVTPAINVIYMDVESGGFISSQYVNVGLLGSFGNTNEIQNVNSFDGWQLKLPFKQGENFHVTLNKEIPVYPDDPSIGTYKFVSADPFLFSNYSLSRMGIDNDTSTNQSNNIPRAYDPNPDGGFPAVKGTSNLRYHYVSDTDASISGTFSLLNNFNVYNGTEESKDFNIVGLTRTLTDSIVIPISRMNNVSGHFNDNGTFTAFNDDTINPDGSFKPESNPQDYINDVNGRSYNPQDGGMDSSITPINDNNNSGINNEPTNNSTTNSNTSNTNSSASATPNDNQSTNSNTTDTDDDAMTGPAVDSNLIINKQVTSSTPAYNYTNAINKSANSDAPIIFYSASSNSSTTASESSSSSASSSVSTNSVTSSSSPSISNSNDSSGSSSDNHNDVNNDKAMYNDEAQILKVNNEFKISIAPKYANVKSNGSLANKYVINHKNSDGKVSHNQLLTLNQFNDLLTASGKKKVTYDEMKKDYSSNGTINIDTTFNAATVKTNNDVVIDTKGDDSGFSKIDDNDTTSNSKKKVSKKHNKHSKTKHHAKHNKHHIKSRAHHRSKEKRKNEFKLSYR